MLPLSIAGSERFDARDTHGAQRKARLHTAYNKAVRARGASPRRTPNIATTSSVRDSAAFSLFPALPRCDWNERRPRSWPTKKRRNTCGTRRLPCRPGSSSTLMQVSGSVGGLRFPLAVHLLTRLFVDSTPTGNPVPWHLTKWSFILGENGKDRCHRRSRGGDAILHKGAS